MSLGGALVARMGPPRAGIIFRRVSLKYWRSPRVVNRPDKGAGGEVRGQVSESSDLDT